MIKITIIWVVISLFCGLVIYLIPKLDRYIALGVTLISIGYALQLFFIKLPLNLELIDNFGITLMIDDLSRYFILTNALVTITVILYSWNTGKSYFFYTLLVILHGSINSVFICADFISLYVALEIIGIATFLLVAYPRSDRSIWVALRYMFVSNTAMLFYLIGAVLVYEANDSFAFEGLTNATTEAVTLIFLGLLTKGGIFISGLWSPFTNSESETPVSALLSGIVEKSATFAIARCALIVDGIDPIVRIFSLASVIFGVFCAILDKDTKRTLAFSTISQLGWILAAPSVGGFYALAHGLAKSAMFLTVGKLPSRNFQELQLQPIHSGHWFALLLPSLSISGFPLFIGYGAKILTFDYLLPFQTIIMNIGAVGTAIVYAKFIFLPHQGWRSIRPGVWVTIIALFGGLMATSIVELEAYTVGNLVKALAIVGIGWIGYFLIFKRYVVVLPRLMEQFEYLVGMMSLILILLFLLLNYFLPTPVWD